MNTKDDIIKQVFRSCIHNALSDLLPGALEEALRSGALKAQEFISLNRATKKYNLCRKTLYNYHRKGYITLHSSEGKTFVSIRDLENHIRNNPLPRHIDEL